MTLEQTLEPWVVQLQGRGKLDFLIFKRNTRPTETRLALGASGSILTELEGGVVLDGDEQHALEFLATLVRRQAKARRARPRRRKIHAAAAAVR